MKYLHTYISSFSYYQTIDIYVVWLFQLRNVFDQTWSLNFVITIVTKRSLSFIVKGYSRKKSSVLLGLYAHCRENHVRIPSTIDKVVEA